MYPVWGFGGEIDSNHVSHCFALNGDVFNPECQGAEGVLNAYKHSLDKVKLAGPAQLSPLLMHVNDYCRQYSADINQ